MKKIFLAFISLSLLFIASGCDKDLPYPIDQVKRGVLVDVSRVAGTDAVLFDGDVSGNFKIKLLIPENQGDYSFMKHAQLLAVLQDVDGSTTSQIVVDNITQIPTEIVINVAEVFSKFGYSAPVVGQTLSFTVNVVLNDGSVIPGWTETTGFNNVAFNGWIVDGRTYSSRVNYPVVCELVLDDFVGTLTVTLDEWSEEAEAPYPVEVTKISDTELSIAGMFNGVAENPMIIKVNLEEYTVAIARQILVPNSGSVWWDPARPTYNNFNLEGSGIIDACDTSISFTATARVDAGSFGSVSFRLGK